LSVLYPLDRLSRSSSISSILLGYNGQLPVQNNVSEGFSVAVHYFFTVS